jgi:hypothetical protein
LMMPMPPRPPAVAIAAIVELSIFIVAVFSLSCTAALRENDQFS